MVKNFEDRKLLKTIWKWNYIFSSSKHNSLLLFPDVISNRSHPPPGLTGSSREAKLLAATLAAHPIEPERRHRVRISHVTWVFLTTLQGCPTAWVTCSPMEITTE